MDFGPTCLYMISRYCGSQFHLEKLRALTEIGKEGVNLIGISDVSEKILFSETSCVCEGVKIPLGVFLVWKLNLMFTALLEIKLFPVLFNSLQAYPDFKL